MRRLVWFGLGAVTGGYVALRGRDKARELAEATSAGSLGRTLGRALGQRKVVMSENLADFVSNMVDGARQREDELKTQRLMPADHPSTRP